MRLTPHSTAFTLLQEYRDKVNRLQTDIKEFRSQCSDLSPIGQLSLRSANSTVRISRYRDQIKTMSRAVSTLQDCHSLSEPLVQPFFNFLQTQIELFQADAGRLISKIHDTRLSNIESATAEAIRCLPPKAEESCDPVLLSLIEKWKQLNVVYENELGCQDELKLLIEMQKREEELASRLATVADSGIEGLKEKVQGRKAELDQVKRQVRKSARESEDVTGEVSRKMAKLKVVTDVLKSPAEQSPLLRAIRGLFTMLQSPIETDEQIRVALDSVIAIARISAVEEPPKRNVPRSPAPRTPVESTLRVLQARIAARKLASV
jgi:archaellum component FlaC